VLQHEVHIVDEMNAILVPSRDVFSLRHIGYYPAQIPHQQNPKFCDWQQVWMQ